MILGYLVPDSPQSVVALASVSTAFYSQARLVQHSSQRIDLGKQEEEARYLGYLSRAGWLAAVRVLRFTVSVSVGPVVRPSDAFLQVLSVAISQMTGLRDVYLSGFEYPLFPGPLLSKLKHQPGIRLHAQTYQYSSRQEVLAPRQIVRLADNSNLHTLGVGVEYHWETAEELTQPGMRRVREILLSNPNLRRLLLDVHTPRFRCGFCGPLREYCGIGLRNGEKLPPLEELGIVDYPWGRKARDIRDEHQGIGVAGYPGEGTEEDYWAEHCDWSNLRRLTLPSSFLARKIVRQLTALEEVSFRCRSRYCELSDNNEQDTVRFLYDLPHALDSLSICKAPWLEMGPILRHGRRLRKLELLRSDFPHMGSDEWKEGALTVDDLVRLRDGLPCLEELAFDVPSSQESDDWPHDMLNVLASFPRLQNLHMTFELLSPTTPDEIPKPPYLTMTSAESLFRYLRDRHPGQYPPLQELHVRTRAATGHLFGSAMWAAENETGMVVSKIPYHHGAAAGDQVLVTCTKVGPKTNERLRRVVRGNTKPTPAEMTLVEFLVALKGPLTHEKWDVVGHHHPYLYMDMDYLPPYPHLFGALSSDLMPPTLTSTR